MTEQPGGTPHAPTLEKTAPDGGGPDGEGQGGDGMAQSASAARYEPQGRADGASGRFWSVRRVPATLLGIALLGAFGALLYDIASVRADRPAAEWRRTIADELATRTLGDGWIVAGAVTAMVAGIWLMALALTPGLRGLLPMRTGNEGLRAGIERRAAAVVLRDRAMEVSGVRSVRVTVGRHRVRVLTEAHFRDLDEVRADLGRVLDHGIGELGLARPLALSVQVRRPERR